MRLKALVCEVAYREVCFCAAKSRNIVDLDFITQGLHDLEATDMCARLQKEVDDTDAEKYDAIVLVYGLCNNGIVGLEAREIPIIIPRAHDCITFFLGSKEDYRSHFDNNPGTYYVTTGWKERDSVNLEQVEDAKMSQLGLSRTYQEYVEKYGEDNAKFLMEVTGSWTDNYKQYTYIEMGLADFLGYDQETEDEARQRGWTFEKRHGELGLFQRLVDGEWDDKDFLTVEPGQAVCSSYDEAIIGARSRG